MSSHTLLIVLLVALGSAQAAVDVAANGHLEATAEVEVGVWWGGDVELALCDARGVVRAVKKGKER